MLLSREESTIKGQNGKTEYFAALCGVKCIVWGENTAGFTRHQRISRNNRSHHVAVAQIQELLKCGTEPGWCGSLQTGADLVTYSGDSERTIRQTWNWSILEILGINRVLRPQRKKVLYFEMRHRTTGLTDVLVGLTMTTEPSFGIWNPRRQVH